MKKLQTTRQATLQTALLILVALLFFSAKCEEGDLGTRDIDNNNCYYSIYDSNDTDNVSEGIDEMKNIETQIDDSTHLSAADFNQIPEELENLIEASGQTLSESDLTQVAKAIANNVSNVYYATSSGSDLYEVSSVNDMKMPTSLYAGLKIDALVLQENTTNLVVLKLGSLSFLPVSNTFLELGEVPHVEIGQFKAYEIVRLVYNMRSDGLEYWLAVGTSLSQLTDGKMIVENVTGSGFTQTTIIDTSNTIAPSISIGAEDNTSDRDNLAYMSTGLFYTEDNNDDGHGIDTTMQGNGIEFGGDSNGRHPTDETPRFNKSVLDMSGLTTTLTFGIMLDSDGDELPLWQSSIRFDLKIPVDCDILGATVNFDNATGSQVVSPASLTALDNSGETWTGFLIVSTGYLNTTAPPRANNMKLYIEFDATNL